MNIQEKKLIVALALLMITLSGCKKTQKRTVTTRNESTEQVGDIAMPIAQNDATSVSLFDEDIEAFVLEEEVDNPFVQDNMKVVQNDTQQLDFTWEEPAHLKDEMVTVHFPYDSCTPLEDQKQLAELTKKAQEIYKNDRIVCLKGHSCKWHGTSVYNLALSMKRSNAMAEYLMQAGIPKSHIKVFGVGNEELVAFDDSQDGQAPNRRVEMYALAA